MEKNQSTLENLENWCSLWGISDKVMDLQEHANKVF